MDESSRWKGSDIGRAANEVRFTVRLSLRVSKSSLLLSPSLSLYVVCPSRPVYPSYPVYPLSPNWPSLTRSASSAPSWSPVCVSTLLYDLWSPARRSVVSCPAVCGLLSGGLRSLVRRSAVSCPAVCISTLLYGLQFPRWRSVVSYLAVCGLLSSLRSLALPASPTRSLIPPLALPSCLIHLVHSVDLQDAALIPLSLASLNMYYVCSDCSASVATVL